MVRKGEVRAFDAGTYTATVRLVGSLAIDVAGVPVSRAIAAGDMVAGRTVAVLQFDEANYTDAMVVGVW